MPPRQTPAPSPGVHVASVAIVGSSEHTPRDFYKLVCGKAARSDEGDCALFCETCKLWVEGDFTSHKASIAHLQSEQKVSGNAHHITIPESNKGYDMLKKMGWNEHAGLGKTAQGVKQPVATQLRTDRSGLGKKKFTARVTHFESRYDLPKSDEEDEGPFPEPTPAPLRAKKEPTRRQQRKAREARIEILEKARDELHREIFRDVG
eukprot:tig00000241_g20981.t1